MLILKRKIFNKLDRLFALIYKGVSPRKSTFGLNSVPNYVEIKTACAVQNVLVLKIDLDNSVNQPIVLSVLPEEYE